MIKSIVKAGVCGFVTTIVADSQDSQNVSFQIESDCDKITELASGLPVVDAYSEIGAGFDGVVHERVKAVMRSCCSGCVVPCAIFKSMQVAAGLALPAECSIEFER